MQLNFSDLITEEIIKSNIKKTLEIKKVSQERQRNSRMLNFVQGLLLLQQK